MIEKNRTARYVARSRSFSGLLARRRFPAGGKKDAANPGDRSAGRRSSRSRLINGHVRLINRVSATNHGVRGHGHKYQL